MIAKIEEEYPSYRQNDDGIKDVGYDSQVIIGYIATYATDNFVYAVYSGKTLLETQEKKITNFEGNILRIFDWDGVLVREYELDVPCSYFCVSDDDSTVWAIASVDGQIMPILFKFKESGTRKTTGDEATKIETPPMNEPQAGRGFSIDVRTKDDRRNAETQKVLDSITNLPPHVSLDVSPTDR